MSCSLSDVACNTRLPGPSAPFPIAPDDVTRVMLMRWQQTYGDLLRVPDERGGPAHWVVHDPELVRQVLVRRATRYAKGAGLDRVRILLGNGIMVSDGAFWARQRRLLQPAFRPRALADFYALFVDENAQLAQRLTARADAGTAFDMAAEVSELTLVIVLKSIFGGDYEQLVAAGDNPFALLAEEPTRDLKFAARFHRLSKVVDRLIDERLQRSDNAFDFLGYLLAARSKTGETMSRRELIDEVMTLIVAGHETTASALAWAWYLLATHENVCARAQAEADAVDEAELRDSGTHASGGLDFIGHVISETLRLYPPGWLLSRRSVAADRFGAHEVPAGAQVFISPYVLHRHGDYWHDPQGFDPGRFERADQPGHRFAYMPFAAGPRHCVGEHMALTEMRVHLAHMLRRFTPRYHGNAPPTMESHINLRPRDGIYLQLTPR